MTAETAAEREQRDLTSPDLAYEDGLYLVGEFLGIRDQRPRTVGDKVYENADVRLLIGSSVVSVQFDSSEAARAAVAGAPERSRIAVRAVNRHGVKNGEGWQFYAGPRPARDAG